MSNETGGVFYFSQVKLYKSFLYKGNTDKSGYGQKFHTHMDPRRYSSWTEVLVGNICDLKFLDQGVLGLSSCTKESSGKALRLNFFC